MNIRADDVEVAYPLFQAGGGGSIPTSALQLRLDPIAFRLAKSLNRLWHSRLPRIGDSDNFRFPSWAAEFDGRWFAVLIWSHPVARALPQNTWLELRRFAISPKAPQNTGSRLLSVNARIIRRELPGIERLISYQDIEVHEGTIYRAAGWTATIQTEGAKGDHHQWSNKSRNRPKSQSTAPKQRWELVL
jgi:hypothetical protein